MSSRLAGERWLMRPRACMVAVALGVGCLAGYPVTASERPFDFRVDRFEIETDPGSSYEFPDFVDEFDGDVLQFILWGPFREGTIGEGGGFLHFKSPGARLVGGFGTLPGVTLDTSEIQSQKTFTKGHGSFTFTSWWAPPDLGPNDN